MSSAYWEILCSLPLIIIPPISWFCLMRIAKISSHMINKYGAIGSPCLHPLWILNCSERKPHCNTAALKSLFRILTQSILMFPKPKNCYTLYKNDHDMESKAFSKSMRTKRPGMFSLSV